MVHDVAAKHPEHSIVIIENGHVTGRKVGDGASHVAMEQVRNADAQPMDHLSYLTKTPDGKILKSSTMYIRGKGGKVVAILGINYDISSLLMVESAVRELTAAGDSTQTEPEKIINVNDVLDELIDRFGEPPAPVLGLIRTSLLRAYSAQHNIYEIGRKGDKLLLYIDDLDMQEISAIAAGFPGRVTVSAAGKPHIAVRIMPQDKMLDLLEKVLMLMNTANKQKDS